MFCLMKNFVSWAVKTMLGTISLVFKELEQVQLKMNIIKIRVLDTISCKR